MPTLQSMDFLDPYASQIPMKLPVPSYTNETNTVQSRPQVDAASYKRSGIEGKIAIEKRFPPVVSPANPAAPDPQTTTQDTNTKAVKSPLVWIGIAAGVFGLFWLVRYAGT